MISVNVASAVDGYSPKYQSSATASQWNEDIIQLANIVPVVPEKRYYAGVVSSSDDWLRLESVVF
jgi:hypothetical protein